MLINMNEDLEMVLSCANLRQKTKNTHVLCLQLRWTFFNNEQQAQRTNCEAYKLSPAKYQSSPHCRPLACSPRLDNYTKYSTALINYQECVSTVSSPTSEMDSRDVSRLCWRFFSAQQNNTHLTARTVIASKQSTYTCTQT